MAFRSVIEAGSKVLVTFPSYWTNSYQVTAYKPIMYTSTTCTKVSGASLSSTLVCTIFSDVDVYLDEGIATSVSAGATISFSMSGILSPATTTSSNKVTLSTETPNGHAVDLS